MTDLVRLLVSASFGVPLFLLALAALSVNLVSCELRNVERARAVRQTGFTSALVLASVLVMLLRFVNLAG
jgi:hypothetical protein